MSRITDEQIFKLAELSRLSVDAVSLTALREDMEEILEYVAKLNRVDTKDVPESHGGGSEIGQLRTDVADPSASALRDALVASFPAKEADMAKVPPVFTRS
jgi:aspartyl-tRNA(Asn)/glutamyl-tRNA(Gln) amidotransferase subunit C